MIEYLKNLKIDNVSLSSVSIAIMIFINYLLAIMAIDGGIYIITILLAILQLLIFKDVFLNIRTVILVLFISIIFVISFIRLENINYTFNYFVKFVYFGVFSLYLTSQVYDIETIYKTILIIGFTTIPFLHNLGFNEMLSGNKMGLSYALLPVIFTSIIKLNHKGYLKYISVIVLVSSIIILVRISSRGVIVSCVIFGILYWISNRRKITKKNIIILFILLILVSMFIMNFIPVLTFVQEILGRIGVDFYPLDKTLLYFRQGKLLNSRDIIWANALKGIIEAPIIGNGIGSFEAKYNTHAHNIFMQTMYEGGLLLILPLLFFSYKIIIVIIREKNISKYKYIIFLFSLSFGSLLFSSTLWYNQAFWILVSVFITNNITVRGDNNAGY